MKYLFFVTFLAFSSANAATIKCEFSSDQYIYMEFDISVDLDSPTVLSNESINGGKSQQITWSVSECEDSSTLTLDQKDYENIENQVFGDLFYAELEHFSPGVQLKGDVECRATR